MGRGRKGAINQSSEKKVSKEVMQKQIKTILCGGVGLKYPLKAAFVETKFGQALVDIQIIEVKIRKEINVD